MRAMSLKNRMCFKITAFIILQMFLLSSTVGAADLGSFATNDNAECLAPSVRLDKSLLMDVFKKVVEGRGLGLFSIGSDEVGMKTAEGKAVFSIRAANEEISNLNNS